MKWFIGLLLALAVVWLLVPRETGSNGEGEVVESSRQVLDAAWRGKPESEMTIGEMESFAAGLGDEKLWRELGKSYDDWLEVNEGRERLDQPRLAIMLAREVGKRDREAGMKKVAEWLIASNLQALRQVLERGDELWEMDSQFGDTRVLMAGYAGWVSVDPDEAISRMIESRRNEENDWPFLNQGFRGYIKPLRFFAIEEVLRDGFAKIARRNLEKAQELLISGMRVWAFDVNKVVESVLAEMSEEGWGEFLDRVVGKVPDRGIEGLGVMSFEDLFKKEVWLSDYQDLRRR